MRTRHIFPLFCHGPLRVWNRWPREGGYSYTEERPDDHQHSYAESQPSPSIGGKTTSVSDPTSSSYGALKIFIEKAGAYTQNGGPSRLSPGAQRHPTRSSRKSA
jgi:hypothetical protein